MSGWSLRSRLFVLIILPLIAVASLAAVARYVMAERMSQQLYDNTLLTVALTISRDVVLSEGDLLTEQLLDSLTNALGDPVYYRIQGPDGRFVTGYSDAPPLPDAALLEPGIPYFYDSVSLGQRVRGVTLREFISQPQFGGWVTVDVWQTVNQRDALSLQLLAQSVVLMAVVVAAAGLLVWFGINLGLRPLLRLREAVALRSADDLGPIRRQVPKEVRNLVAAMNSLFGRLSAAFEVRDSFISEAAHQLRNPIAALQAQAEAATTAPDETELRRRFAERELPRGVSVSFHLEGRARTVTADPVMLAEAIENLLDNAARYGCPDGGDIGLTLVFEEAQVTLRVTDSGQGIPEEARERVFDRFCRLGDDASGGCGLGLAIVRRVAEAHGGTAVVAQDARSMAVELRIPARAA